MKIRPPKPDDQDQCDKACDLLYDFLKENNHIEPTIWVSSMISVIAQSYINTGLSHEFFCRELDFIKKQSEEWFKNDQA